MGLVLLVSMKAKKFMFIVKNETYNQIIVSKLSLIHIPCEVASN